MEAEWMRGLAGGLMIGFAGALLLLWNGRIMGVSGILGGLVERASASQTGERLLFLAGLVGAPAVLALISREGAQTFITSNLVLIVAAGLLVGLGTRIGNGCTSGHGVCGISRFSIRSIVATCTFIAAGAVTVLVLRLMGGL